MIARSAAAAFAVLVLAGCTEPAAQSAAAPAAPAAAANCPPATIAMVRYELHLGGDVGDNDFSDFLDTEVTPRFPRGVTVIDAHSQAQEMNNAISKEGSRILLVVVPNTLTGSAYVSAIGAAYNERFGQDGALLVQANVCAGFVGTALPD
jgi:hypothetical protein